MLKKIAVIILLLLPIIYANGQVTTYEVAGLIKGTSYYKYAYLYQSETKNLLKTKVQNQQFLFVGEFTLERKGFNAAFIFLSNDSLDKFIDQQEVVLKQLDRQYRIMVMDGTPIKITIEDEVKNAKVEGGNLNKDYDEMNLAVRERRYIDFIESHSDSPISLLLIRGILPMKKFPFIGQLDFQELYDKLSDKVRQSEYGLETLKKIKNL